MAEKGTNTRERLKTAAQRLIAERGVDGVAVRDVVTAADQKNMASLHYYFGTKEELIVELVVDSAKLMEGRRKAALDALEASGGPTTIREVVAIIVGGAVADGQDENEFTVLRFLTSLYPNYRHLFDQAIGNRWNKTYQKCLDYIREFATDIPPAVLDQRLLFVSWSTFQLLAAREAAIATGGSAREYWAAQSTMDNIIDSLCGMITAPVSSSAIPKDSVKRLDRKVRHFAGSVE